MRCNTTQSVLIHTRACECKSKARQNALNKLTAATDMFCYGVARVTYVLIIVTNLSTSGLPEAKAALQAPETKDKRFISY